VFQAWIRSDQSNQTVSQRLQPLTNFPAIFDSSDVRLPSHFARTPHFVSQVDFGRSVRAGKLRGQFHGRGDGNTHAPNAKSGADGKRRTHVSDEVFDRSHSDEPFALNQPLQLWPRAS
jgi:hypothetical protein